MAFFERGRCYLKYLENLKFFIAFLTPKQKEIMEVCQKHNCIVADNAYQKLNLFQRKVTRKTKSNKTNVKVKDPFVDAVSYF